MTDETPASEEPTSSTPPEETPTAETAPPAPDDVVAPASEAPTEAVQPDPAAAAEAPTQATPVAPVAPVAAAPVAAAPVATAPTDDRPAGIFIPKWVGIVAAAIIAALVFGGIGYAIGDSSGSDSQNASNTIPSGNGTRQLPNGNQLPGGGLFPGNENGTGNSNGNGTGNGQNGTGNSNGSGTGNGNGSGTGNGGSTATDSAFLGVGVQTADGGQGVEVTAVADGSPAATAGLKEGDVITAIDGTNVTTDVALRSAVLAKKSGDVVTIAYTRDGAANTVKATLTTRSQAQSS